MNLSAWEEMCTENNNTRGKYFFLAFKVLLVWEAC